MKCEECNSTSNYFDERLGERVCEDCGLVLVTELFEETVHILDESSNLIRSSDKGHLGSVITGKGSYKLNRFNDSVLPKHVTTGFMYCNLVLSNVNASNDANRERVEKIYLDLLRNGISTKNTYEDRATAIVYYVLKENGTPQKIKEVCAEFDAEPKIVMRIVRKINKHYKNKINYSEIDPMYYLERTLNKITTDLSYMRQCKRVLVEFDKVMVSTNSNKSRSYYASICWITSNIYQRYDISQKLIAEKTQIDPKCIYEQTKYLLKLIGKTKVSELKGIEIEKIGE